MYCTLDLVFEVDISFTKLLPNYYQGRMRSVRGMITGPKGEAPVGARGDAPGKFLENIGFYCILERFQH